MPAVEATTMTPPRPRSTIGRQEGVGEGDDRLAVDADLLRVASASSISTKGPWVPKPALLTSRSIVEAERVDLARGSCGVGAEVAGDDVGVGRQLGGELLEPVGTAGDEDEVVAARRELAGELFADSGGSSCDEGGFGHGVRAYSARGGARDDDEGASRSGSRPGRRSTSGSRRRARIRRDRREPEPDSPVRTPFQRDRDRIVHSKAFRRLKHKTQVFIAPEGDHYRTRLTHTLETCCIARTVARALGLNEDLTEAIGLGHDLGHPPFGHIGEEALDAALQERVGQRGSSTTSSRCGWSTCSSATGRGST